MKKIVLGLVAAAATLTAGAAMAQPYGYYSDRGVYGYDRGGYGYDRVVRYRDSDGDGAGGGLKAVRRSPETRVVFSR